MLPDKPSYEVVDAIELAQRWRVPVSWIREQTRDRACGERREHDSVDLPSNG
jgi:hypothetical protein